MCGGAERPTTEEKGHFDLPVQPTLTIAMLWEKMSKAHQIVWGRIEMVLLSAIAKIGNDCNWGRVWRSIALYLHVRCRYS